MACRCVSNNSVFGLAPGNCCCQGEKGDKGDKGDQGDQGPPGDGDAEVTNASVNAAIGLNVPATKAVLNYTAAQVGADPSGAAAAAQTAAQNHSNAQDAIQTAALNGAIAAGDAATLNAANIFASGAAAAAQTAAQNYSDTQDVTQTNALNVAIAAAQTNAQNYSDAQDAIQTAALTSMIASSQTTANNYSNAQDVIQTVALTAAFNAADAVTLTAAQAYADSIALGLVEDVGNYDASTNLFPATGGSGLAGAIMQGDLWAVSVAGVLGGQAVTPGDWFRALINNPAQVAANWAIIQSNLTYTPENVANKATNLAAPDNTKYPTTLAVSNALAAKTLNDLADVVIAAPQILQSVGYNGSEFVNGFPALFESDGILSGCEITVLSATQVRIAAGVLGFTDYTANAVNPPRTLLSFPQTDVTITNIALQPETYLAIRNDGIVIQQATDFTNTQRRTHGVVGIAVHTNLVSINVVNKLPVVIRAGIDTLYDFLIYHGREHRGLVYSANGTNLNLNRSSGSQFIAGANFYTNPLDPNVLPLPALAALTFRYRTQIGEPAGDITAVNPNLYNPAIGTLTAVPANDWTAQPIYVFPSGLTRIQYGQQTWTSLANAVINFRSAPFVVEGNIDRNAIRAGWLIVKQGATALDNTAQAFFVADSGLSSSSSSVVQLTSTDLLPEGVSNLYFTNARARTANRAPDVSSAVSGATLVPTPAFDAFIRTAQAVPLAINNPTGVWAEMQTFTIRLKDSGVAQGLTFDTAYRDTDVALPITTVAGKLLYLTIRANTADGTFDVIRVAQEA